MGIKHLLKKQANTTVTKVVPEEDIKQSIDQIKDLFLKFPFEEAYKEGYDLKEILKVFEAMDKEWSIQMDLLRKKANQ